MNPRPAIIADAVPRFNDVKEPELVALVVTGRAGTKVLQSFLDGHEQVLTIPAYPLMYLYPHWNTWAARYGSDFSWQRAVDLLCEKHASFLDSRKVPGLSGLERLGPEQDQHIEIDEGLFRTTLAAMLDGQPVRRRTFLLAVHYAYALAKGWDIESRPVLLYHIHDPSFLRDLADDFPDMQVWTMLREPKASLSSTLRSIGIIDEEKLNPTDYIRNSGRNFRIDCRLEFEVLDQMGTYLRRDQVFALQHEDLHRDLEGTMRRVSRRLGIEFTEGLLQSTFDGKLWWGDVTNKTPVNGLDPAATSTDRWRRSMNRVDSYVVEGITSSFYGEYGYEMISYRRDTVWRRLLLAMAILLPSKVELLEAARYLDPRTHVRFLRAALAESTGRIPRKDYTWSATYRYKFNYVDLKLWNSRWHERLLDHVSSRVQDGSRGLGLGLFAARTVYVVAQYGRLWASILAFPVHVIRRWGIYYGCLLRRLRGRAFLPPQL